MNKNLPQYVIFLIFFVLLILTFYAFYNKDLRLSFVGYFLSNKSNHNLQFVNSIPTFTVETPVSNSAPYASVLLISDIHQSTQNLNKIMEISKPTAFSLVFIVGDITNFGDIYSLNLVRDSILNFKPSAIIPGDHDIAQSSSLSNFIKVFDMPKNEYRISEIKVAVLMNHSNFTPFSNLEHEKNLKAISNADVVVAAQPIYMPNNDIFSDRYMGNFSYDKSSLNQEQLDGLKIYMSQRNDYLELIRRSKKNLIFVAGDHHRSLIFKDPTNDKVTYYNMGAISEEVSFGNSILKQKALQPPRFAVLTISKITDNSDSFIFNIEEKILD